MRVQQFDSLLNEERGLIHKLDVLLLVSVCLYYGICVGICLSVI